MSSPGAELDLSMLSGVVAVMLLGGGAVSIDSRLGLEPDDIVGIGARSVVSADR